VAALRDLAAIGSALTTYLSDAWGRPVTATGLVETSAGARRGNVLFDALDPDHPDGPRTWELVVTIYPPAEAVIFGVEAEAAVLRLGEAAGAPVAHVYEVGTDPSWFGEPFFISQRIPGETLAPRILRLAAATPGLGERIGAQLGRGFAGIHRVAATDAPEQVRRPLDEAPSAHALALLAGQLDELADPAPTFALGLRWLERNQPGPPPRHTLVHADVRNGNIVVGPDGLAAILDWEGAHTGDPHEDLAWACVRTWRFGGDALPVGGFSPLGPMVDAYREAGGRYDPDAFRWWLVFGHVKWGIGFSRQAVQHLTGAYRSIVMAASGRRAVECEHDVLRLLSALL
jgi:aminoglycoside phosphotransferase (APT) family kinase protein